MELPSSAPSFHSCFPFRVGFSLWFGSAPAIGRFLFQTNALGFWSYRFYNSFWCRIHNGCNNNLASTKVVWYGEVRTKNTIQCMLFVFVVLPGVSPRAQWFEKPNPSLLEISNLDPCFRNTDIKIELRAQTSCVETSSWRVQTRTAIVIFNISW